MNQLSLKINHRLSKSVFFLILSIFFLTNRSNAAGEDSRSEYKHAPFIDIIYLANLNGNTVNCECGNPSLGGLPQIATILKQKRTENPKCIFIDGGDFLNTYPFRDLNATVLKIYETISPDIICLGDQEFIESDQFSQMLINGLQEKLITSNYYLEPIPPEKRKSYLQMDINQQRICLLSYLSSEAFSVHNYPDMIQFDDKTFHETYEQYKSENFLIVLFHGPFQALKNLINKYPDIDLVLLAHEQSYISETDISPAIIGGGVDGEMLMEIKVFGTDHKFRYDISRIQVRKDIEQDPEISAIIKTSENKGNPGGR